MSEPMSALPDLRTVSIVHDADTDRMSIIHDDDLDPHHALGLLVAVARRLARQSGVGAARASWRDRGSRRE